jgi:hypothetical protein
MEEAIEAATTSKDHPSSAAHSRHAHPNTSRGITGARRGRGRTSGTAVPQAWPRGGPGAKRAHMGVATHFLNVVARGHSSITSPLGPASLHGVKPHRSRAMRAMAPARKLPPAGASAYACSRVSGRVGSGSGPGRARTTFAGVGALGRAHGERYPFRSVPARTRLDGWMTRVGTPLP